MQTTAAESTTEYIFTVTEGEFTFVYSFSKTPPETVLVEGQESIQISLPDYLQSCKREAELLAADEIARLQPPTPIDLG